MLANKLVPEDILQISQPPAQPPKLAGLCLIRRGHEHDTQEYSADFCINSMADLVAQHQLSLRR